MKNAWTKWKELAEKAGNVQANIIFSFFFFVIITPASFVLRIFKDLLHLKNKPQWYAVETEIDTIRSMKEQ